MTIVEFWLPWLVLGWMMVRVHSFQGCFCGKDFHSGANLRSLVLPTRTLSESVVVLQSSIPPKRKARRDLQKRRRRRRPGDGDDNVSESEDDNFDSAAIYEYRPLIPSEAREKGVDYWMDEEEMRRYMEQQREEALRRRKRPKSEGQVPDEKLWKEVLSPYKENWIGYFSLAIVMIATILANFPELLQTPVISIPDL